MKAAVLAVALSAAPALAQADEPRFCPQRPSLGASACTTEPGEVQLEVSGVDWQLERDPAQRTDTFLFGDAVARIGVGPTTELQVGWTPVGSVRTNDRLIGEIGRQTRIGDVTIGVRQNVANPDGSGLSYGVQPFVQLPVGRRPIGEGDWTAGMLIPATYDLSETQNVQFTGEIDAAVDGDGHGRHLAYSGILGLSRQLDDHFVLTGEVMVGRDHDPAGHRTSAVAAGSLAWRPRATWQIDALAVAGLNRDAPDVRLVFGGAILLGHRPR